MTEIQPFTVEASKAEIDNLRNRLSGTRWPDSETPDDWSQGVPIAYAKEFCEYWAKEYDWSERCDLLNSFAQFITRIDGLDIHFIHVPSPVATARPIVLTHGWPGSVVEFLKVIGPLTDPVPHGGDAADAFHVVCPSLPGYGYSGKPAETGYGVGKIAAMWDQLMLAVGYDGYFAQGGDWGAAVTTAIGMQNLGHCKGIHLNMPSAGPTKDARENPTDEDKLALERSQAYQDWDSGYSKQQSTRPQTLGYGLADSPAGQAMWILEKFWRWTDCQGHPENVLSRNELIDNIMLYWLTNSGASSARLYWESFNRTAGGGGNNSVTVPTGCSIFPQEIVPTPRSWAERRYPNIVYWNKLEKGGHFAAFEQPELFVAELRSCFRMM
ncbi:MAG: epoxide hydrolase [Pseudomonadales bacterium]|jgi:pimeloyl-ACP methyl ester carboxylesterase|nr:epoxide hydrolase [Pseudomonadales bacterium]HJN51900.1 epoxide hydrolase [Pseudomonadales bacterium]|tara:strand:- start:7 stop:1152 length:1146 start_codon:yes stop_codon:yes gene_type:complete